MARLKDTVIDGDLIITGTLTYNSLDGNLEVRSNKLTEWGFSQSHEEYPSARLVKETIDNLKIEGGSGGGGGPTTDVIIGLFGEHDEDSYDVVWENLITKDERSGLYENWVEFINEVCEKNKSIVFLNGLYSVPSDMYFLIDNNGPVFIPLLNIRGEHSGLGRDGSYVNEDTTSIIKLNYSEGGSFCTDTLTLDQSVVISNLVVECNNKAVFGIFIMNPSNSALIERVLIREANAAGIAIGTPNSIVSNCYCVNCGTSEFGEFAAGIALTGEFNNDKTFSSIVENCRVKGGSFAGIGLLRTDYCKIVNCHVEDFGKIGIGLINGNNNIITNNTVVRSQFADPQDDEFGILLNETNKGLVSNNIVENGYIVENNSSDCLVTNNIGDTIP